MTTPTLAAALVQFVAFAQKVCSDYRQAHFPMLGDVTLSVEEGRRYAKIVRTDNGRSVHCFVDLTNGDILKAAGWKAPAKHARGSILDPATYAAAVGPYGAAYLK